MSFFICFQSAMFQNFARSIPYVSLIRKLFDKKCLCACFSVNLLNGTFSKFLFTSFFMISMVWHTTTKTEPKTSFEDSTVGV